MTDRCNRPDCTGTVDETGFCDTCDRRPLPATTGGGPASFAVTGTTGSGSGSGSTASGGPSWLVGGLVPMPELEPADPVSRLRGDTEVPEASRFCGRCRAEVGRGYAGQPGLLEGFCGHCTTPFSFAPKLHRGDLVADQYEVDGCLARGGLGWVYLARDTHLDGNPVVLKGLITNSDAALRLAVAERRFLTTLDHPNIVRIFNSVNHRDPQTGERAGYIVMEYLNGQSLQDVQEAAARGVAPLPVEHVLAYGHEILAAMEYLHGRGLLYCDMKPANVIRCPDRIKVIDIGGVRRIDDDQSPKVGTDFYQVPPDEIRRHGLTVRSDIHTVGRTLQVLFEVSEEGRRAAPAGRADGIAFGVESFVRLVNRAVAGHDRRFATAAEMSQQLKGVLRELLSLRTGRPHPVRSTVFAPTPVLLDAGLGAVPGLDVWIRGETGLLDIAPPSPSSAAGALPQPVVDPDDEAVDLLATAGAADPRGLVEKLANSGLRSVEVRFALCRAYLEAGDPDSAAGALDAAVTDLGPLADHDWRVRWHRGLLALSRATGPAAEAWAAGAQLNAADTEFNAVYSDCPGEIAPKLALAFCAEHLGERFRAEQLYQAIWRRDRSEGSAAFGLARLRLHDGDRAGAVRVLDEVPRETLHYERARVAAVRILCGRLPVGGPSVDDIAEALRRLPALHLDGGNPTGEARDRLTALVQAAALGLFRDGGRAGPGEGHGSRLGEGLGERLGGGLGDRADVLGPEPTEDGLRRRLERSMRVLAGQARTIEDHGALVDLANAVRPRTPW
ncbi:tetratricopeptide repeat protein [Micromonospora sp. WMMD1102]|uniref:serine/threonine-protein kinase n=1 Tax=Micromonospora sp. WMMD1102 TaxID=3016105 RepID=UPI0024153F6A|nr:serine/threonine-protein kinase [Micromonospora sp. WMMD1102]MDG4785692.1 tetratricopeptide repeat protein [Micromonospora sp. WMMD1102]MDG4792165.1 tetratricopeptide repeat protein [Micromonospora sp. WMMD1102]